MKKTVMTVLLAMCVLIIFAATYYSQGSLAPELTTSWNSDRGGIGTAPANFTGADTFVIQMGHEMTTAATWTVSNASSMVEIENGGVLKAITGAPATLSGIFQIDGGGRYSHAVASGTGVGTIPGNAGRRFANSTNGGLGNGTFEIRASDTAFSTTGITWGDVVVNNNTQPSNLNYAAVFADVEGMLSVKSTNNYEFQLTGDETTSHLIRGNLRIENASSVLSFKSGTGSVDVSVYGNVMVSGGVLNMASASSGTGNLYFRGFFDLMGGTLTEGSSSTDCTIYLDGSATQNFSRTGGTISNNINFSVPSGKTLDVGNSVIDGDGNFDLADGGYLRLSFSEGISSSGSTGSIQVSGSRTFGTAANYEYYGPAAMITGSGLPTSVNNLTLNTIETITLSNDLTVNGTFNVINGAMILGDNNFTATGSVPLNPIFVYNGTGTASGMGPNSMITVNVTNPSSLPSTMNELIVDVGAGNTLQLPNDVFAANMVFTSGSLAVGNFVLGCGSPTGDAQVIYDGSGRIECNGSNLEITITTTNPGNLPGDLGSLIINSAGTVLMPNNIHLGTITMLAGSLDLNNKSVNFEDLGIDIGGEVVLTNLAITMTAAATVVGGPQNSIQRIWNITGTSSEDFLTTFFWPVTADNGNDFSSGNCNVWNYASGSWADLGMKGVTTDAGVRSTNLRIDLGAKDAEGDYTITGDGPTLPVELSSFTAIPTAEQYITLNWITQSETNLSGYRIFRSTESEISEATMLNVFINANNSSTQSSYSFTDDEVQTGITWYYWLQVVEMDGTNFFHGPVNVFLNDSINENNPVIPNTTTLNCIFPNPFNPSATISYSLDKSSHVNIQVYNLRGKLVRNVYSGTKDSGLHYLPWDGTDENGKECPSGVYLFKLKTSDNTLVQKALLVK